MKNIKLFSIFFVSFCLTIILQSCSNENLITTPTDNKGEMKPMTKTVALPTSSINHAADTVITLPKSGKTFLFSKNIPASMLNKIDEYLTKHTISFSTRTMQPNLPSCNQHGEQYWELENQYQPINGKTLGIWQNWTSPSQPYSLGFREIMIEYAPDRDSAYNNGFQYQNMMWVTGNNVGEAENVFNSIYSADKPVTRCFIDEPLEESSAYPWTSSDLASFINFLYTYPSTTLTVSSWHSPNYPYENLVSIPIVYIMDDFYKGDVTSAWTDFKNGYGSKNVANWISLEDNQDGTGYSDYSQCFGAANRLGLSDIWLYALDYNRIDLLEQFSYSAWANSWLSRMEQYVTIEWSCSGNCTTCNWPNGNWYVTDIYYGTQQWVNY